MDEGKQNTPKVEVKTIGLYAPQNTWIEKTVKKQHRMGIAMDRSKLIRWLIDKEIEAEKKKTGAK